MPTISCPTILPLPCPPKKDIIKIQKTQFEESKQASKLDLDTAGVLELLQWEFKRTMIKMLRALMGKGDSMNRWEM